jgi:hypothetical protein
MRANLSGRTSFGGGNGKELGGLITAYEKRDESGILYKATALTFQDELENVVSIHHPRKEKGGVDECCRCETCWVLSVVII